MPSTSCYLFTCIVWSWYGQWLRKCIYKKIHCLTLTKVKGARSHKIFPSTLDIMWPTNCMHLQNSMLLHPTVKEMHLQGNTYLTLNLGSRFKNCCPVPSTFCDLCNYRTYSYYVKRFTRRCIYQKIQYLTFDLGVKVPQHVDQVSLNHVTYSATKFVGATSNGLRVDTFTKNTFFDLDLGVKVTGNVAQYPLHHVTY